MPNRFQLNNLYNKYISMVLPSLLGEPYAIYRPDYTVIDNEPVLIDNNVLLRIDPTRSFIETAFSTPKYFSVFANRSILQPGDLIVYGTYNSPIIDRPYITYAHEGPIKEAIGVRTAQKCHLADGLADQNGNYSYIAKNVWYDTLDNGHPLERINEGVKNSQKVPSQSIVMYNRSNIVIDTRTIIIDINPTTGEPTGYAWVAKQVDRSGQLVLMNVSQDFGSY